MTNNSSILTSLKKAYDRFLKIRGNPREIALGFALGIFVGMSPTLGFQMAIAVFFAALLKWNKISSAIGVWISNPLTAPIIYSMTYFTGAKILGIANGNPEPVELGDKTLSAILQKAPDLLGALVLGGVVIGLPLAAAGYFFSYSAVEKYQEGIRQKLAERRAKRASKKMRKKLAKKRSKKATPPASVK